MTDQNEDYADQDERVDDQFGDGNGFLGVEHVDNGIIVVQLGYFSNLVR